MDKSVGINEALQALKNIFHFCEEIDLHLPDEEKTGYQMLPDYRLVNQYIKNNERKHGHWVMDENPHDGDVRCSRCGICCDAMHERYHERYKLMGCKNPLTWYTYCPVCGAIMDEDVDAICGGK